MSATAIKGAKSAYINDIPAVIEAIFGPSDKAPPPLEQTVVQNVTIPDNLCTGSTTERFQQLLAVISTTSSTTEATLAALNYLIDTPLRDQHRFLPYLQKYASELLAGCARQLEHFLQTDYPNVLLEIEGGENGDEGSSKLFKQSQHLLQSVAIVAVNLIISCDINEHIAVSSFSAFYIALLHYRIESKKATKSEKLNYTLLYIITDDYSLWIEKDIHRKLSAKQFEAIFATLYQLLNDSSGGDANQLTDQQWKMAKLIFGDIERLQSRIWEAISIESFLKQANAILKAFPTSSFAAEHNFSPLEVLSEGIFLIVKKKEKEKFLDVQSWMSNLLVAFKDSEPIVPFVQKLLRESELVFQDEKKKRREKVKVCPDEIDCDLLDFSFLDAPDALGQQQPSDEGLKKSSANDKKDAHGTVGPKCCDHTSENDNCKKKAIPLPKPTITIMAKSSTDPAQQCLEQVTALSSTNNIEHSHCIVAYLNRNLDDLICLYPNVFEPHLNELINNLSRLYNQIHLFAECGGFERARTECTGYFNALTALLKRIFAYSHLQRALDFENAYPLLLVTVAPFHGSFYDVDYGFHALKDTLFETHHSVQMGSRLLFTVRMLTFLEDNYGGKLQYYYGLTHLFTKGARRLLPGVNAASLGGDLVGELLTAVGHFLEHFEAEEWSYTDSTTMVCHLEPPLFGYAFIYPLDFVKRLLYIVVKSQGESIWAQYYRVFPKERELLGKTTTTTTTTTTPLAAFIRLALNGNFQGQKMCTGKCELRRLTEWPPAYYGQSSSHAFVPFDDLQDNWDFSTKSYPDNSAKVDQLTREILPKFNSAYKDYRWIADTFKELRKHMAAYAKNPKQFGGQVISKLFESSLRLLEHYLKKVVDLETGNANQRSSDELKDAILAIAGFFESLLNIELAETDSSMWPFPKYQLKLKLDDYADLLEALLTVRYHYGLYVAPKLLSLDWLLKYKANSATVFAAIIRVFNRAATADTLRADTKQLYVLITLGKFLGEVTIPNQVRVSREERLQVLVRRVRTSASLEIILDEAGLLMERFKGSILEREHLYLTWQVVDELLSALVIVKTDMVRAAVEKAKKTRRKGNGQLLLELLEHRLERYDRVKGDGC